MKLTNRETAALCRSLSLLLHAGIGMADSVHLLARDHSGPMEEMLHQLGNHMDNGGRLSEAMAESGAFPVSASAMVAIGEETGTLEEALASLADYHDQRHRTSRQIKNALAYPSLILILMLGVIGVLLVKVLPVFDSVYASLGGQLTGLSAGLWPWAWAADCRWRNLWIWPVSCWKISPKLPAGAGPVPKRSAGVKT